jgi:hypothetical protein
MIFAMDNAPSRPAPRRRAADVYDGCEKPL